jgi:hypothetical protein
MKKMKRPRIKRFSWTNNLLNSGLTRENLKTGKREKWRNFRSLRTKKEKGMQLSEKSLRRSKRTPSLWLRKITSSKKRTIDSRKSCRDLKSSSFPRSKLTRNKVISKRKKTTILRSKFKSCLMRSSTLRN